VIAAQTATEVFGYEVAEGPYHGYLAAESEPTQPPRGKMAAGPSLRVVGGTDVGPKPQADAL